MELLATLTGSLAVVLSLSSYLMRTHRSLTYAAAAGVLCWALYFAFKGVWTPSVLSALMAVRIAAGVKVVVLSHRTRWQLTLLVWALTSLGAYLTWQGWVSLPSTVATTFLTYTGFHFRYLALRRALLLSELLWFANGCVTESTLGMAAAVGGFGINCGILWWEARNTRLLAGKAAFPPLVGIL
jgi:hypothetical protein